MNNCTIRPARSGDEKGAYHVCLKTGDNGAEVAGGTATNGGQPTNGLNGELPFQDSDELRSLIAHGQ